MASLPHILGNLICYCTHVNGTTDAGLLSKLLLIEWITFRKNIENLLLLAAAWQLDAVSSNRIKFRSRDGRWGRRTRKRGESRGGQQVQSSFLHRSSEQFGLNISQWVEFYMHCVFASSLATLYIHQQWVTPIGFFNAAFPLKTCNTVTYPLGYILFSVSRVYFQSQIHPSSGFKFRVPACKWGKSCIQGNLLATNNVIIALARVSFSKALQWNIIFSLVCLIISSGFSRTILRKHNHPMPLCNVFNP